MNIGRTHHFHHHHHHHHRGGRGRAQDNLSKPLRRSTSALEDDVALSPETMERLVGGGLTRELNPGAEGFPQVIKVFTTIQEPDYDNPWQTSGIQQATGSGVVISPTCILTAAHVVANQTFIQVQRTDDPAMRQASVFAVNHECDLALLMVSERKFFTGITPATIGELPRRRDRVLVCGFPVGGEELSITEGVVSRIEGQPYSHSQRVLLAVTVDAAINAGNSGGPVFNEEGELVGIAFQALMGAENNGHIIPPPVILHFLKGIQTFGSRYLGFPSLAINIQYLTNPLLRESLGMDPEQAGVLVIDVAYGNTCHGLIEKNDVLVEIGGYPVASNGTIPWQSHLRMDFQLIASLLQCSDKLIMKVLRNGKELKLEVTMKPQIELVPLAQYDRMPAYFVYFGLVFQPLSLDYLLKNFGMAAAAPKYFLYLFESGVPSKDRTQVVVLSQVLNDELNQGYDELSNSVIEMVNGKKISNLAGLMKEIESTTSQTVEIITHEGEKIILPSPSNPKAAAMQKRILDHYRVPEDRGGSYDEVFGVQEDKSIVPYDLSAQEVTDWFTGKRTDPLPSPHSAKKA